MKKFILTFALLLSGITLCFADFVGKDQVNEIAKKWFSSENFTVTLDESSTLYYVNATDGGWIIISAEDSTTPVIGYSDTGSIDLNKMPSHVKYFMGSYSKSIDAVRDANLQANPTVKKLWRSAGIRTKATGGKLLSTASWDQDEPYNLFCPEVTESGRKYTALTGCVATSAAIILRYHRWPEKGKGTIGGYSYKSDYNKNVNIPAYSIDDHVYNYDLMPLSYTKSATQAQKEAVSLLMHDLGVMFQANYNYQTGTGAYAEDIQKALFEHMGYSGKAYHLYRNACSDAEFLKIMKAEIDADRPIPYGGSDPQNGGHQFLCDGYDAKDYIHINWGWSGDSNGYFTLTLNVPQQFTFSESQSILVGLEPDRDASTSNNGGPLVLLYDNSLAAYKGIAVTGGSIESKDFELKVGAIYNTDMNVFYKGKIRMALVDYTGKVKEVISSEEEHTFEDSEIKGIASIKCKVSADYCLGDRIVAQFLAKGGEWEDIKCHTEFATFPNGIAVIDTPFIRIEDSYSAGDSFYIEIIPGNSLVSSYTWSFDGLTQKHASVCPLTAGTHVVKAKVTLKNGSSYVLTQKINVN